GCPPGRLPGRRRLPDRPVRRREPGARRAAAARACREQGPVIGGALAGLLWVTVAAASAQEPAPPPEDRRPREEAFRMIDAYFVSNLQESLGLTDEQFVRLLPMVKRLQTDRRQYAQRRQRA